VSTRLEQHGQRHIDMGEQQELFKDIKSIDRSKGTNICIKCGEEKPVTSFARYYVAAQTEAVCVKCRKNLGDRVKELKKKHPKPDPKTFQCPICERKGFSWKMGATLDHDHKTGNFRGWICNKCNSALGFFEDDINYVRRSVNYLEEYEDRCQKGNIYERKHTDGT